MRSAGGRFRVTAAEAWRRIGLMTKLGWLAGAVLLSSTVFCTCIGHNVFKRAFMTPYTGYGPHWGRARDGFSRISMSTVYRLIDITPVDPDWSKAVDIGTPFLEFSPSPLTKQSPSSFHGSKDVLFCDRIAVSGRSRLELGSYANSFRVTLAPSVTIREKLHGKIMICSHKNASLGLCQCDQNDWRSLQKGIWSSAMSPYDDVYMDVKVTGELPGSISISVGEELHRWRLYCLAIGFVFLLLAPVFSSWAPFYYSSSMFIGILLVILILLFQGMKLVPGRKNIFYLFVSGPMVGVGSLIIYYFSTLVNSFLGNFGMSEEMHHLVYIFVIVGVLLAGAGLGYWMVRKFVISEDGTVAIGVAQFVKWAMRIIAAILYLQSTLDVPLAVVAFFASSAICFLVSKWKDVIESAMESYWFLRSRGATANYSRAEFRSRRLRNGQRGTLWSSPKISNAWSNSPIKGVVSPSSGSETRTDKEYYSTFHKTPKRKISKKDWENSKRESTRQALGDLTSSPEFLNWVIENAERVHVLPDDSSDGTVESGSDSSEETALQSGNRKLWNW